MTNPGPCVQEFEERIAEFIGAKHCIVTNNAKTALEIAARALGMDGEIIVPSITFIATAHALQWQGIKPVFCDIDPVTHSIDLRQVERLITPRRDSIVIGGETVVGAGGLILDNTREKEIIWAGPPNCCEFPVTDCRWGESS